MESICVFQSIIALPDRDLLAILVLKQTDDDRRFWARKIQSMCITRSLHTKKRE